MSDDIVEILRDGQTEGVGNYHLRFAADEIVRLRKVVCRYGDRIRMAMAADPALQQSIDDAFTYTETTDI